MRVAQKRSRLDLVDLIDAAGHVLLRHPFLSMGLVSEATLLLVGLGWMPEPVALLVGFPAYAVHTLSALAFGPSYLPALAGLLGLAGFLDMLWRGLVRVLRPGPV